MATDRDRLTTFFYYLISVTSRLGGVPTDALRNMIDSDEPLPTDTEDDARLACEMASTLSSEFTRLWAALGDVSPPPGPAAPVGVHATLRAAAEMLTRVRRSPGTQTEFDLESMIDRCNLAAMGVAYDGDPAPTPRDVLAGLGWRCVETEAIAGKAHELWSKAGADDAVRLTAWVSSAGVEADSDALLSPTELRAFAAHAESL
jgi:hypothetical protein